MIEKIEACGECGKDKITKDYIVCHDNLMGKIPICQADTEEEAIGGASGASQSICGILGGFCVLQRKFIEPGIPAVRRIAECIDGYPWEYVQTDHAYMSGVIQTSDGRIIAKDVTARDAMLIIALAASQYGEKLNV